MKTIINAIVQGILMGIGIVAIIFFFLPQEEGRIEVECSSTKRICKAVKVENIKNKTLNILFNWTK